MYNEKLYLYLVRNCESAKTEKQPISHRKI